MVHSHPATQTAVDAAAVSASGLTARSNNESDLPSPRYDTSPLPPIGLSQDETPIRDDVRLLGNILGETLISPGGANPI